MNEWLVKIFVTNSLRSSCWKIHGGYHFYFCGCFFNGSFNLVSMQFSTDQHILHCYCFSRLSWPLHCQTTTYQFHRQVSLQTKTIVAFQLSWVLKSNLTLTITVFVSVISQFISYNILQFCWRWWIGCIDSIITVYILSQVKGKESRCLLPHLSFCEHHLSKPVVHNCNEWISFTLCQIVSWHCLDNIVKNKQDRSATKTLPKCNFWISLVLWPKKFIQQLFCTKFK